MGDVNDVMGTIADGSYDIGDIDVGDVWMMMISFYLIFDEPLVGIVAT